jgi:Transposase IS116/IS110/IS902 family./Transposase.
MNLKTYKMEQDQAMYLGIDVSKGYADFYLMDARKQMMEKSFQLDDNLQGHQRLTMSLEKYTSTGKKIICGVESTGGYEQNWLILLKRLKKQTPVEVYKLNPKGVKHQIESTLKRTITDSVSAEGIADYLANNYEQAQQKWEKSTNQDETIIASQRCFNLIMGLIKQQTARYNQLEKLLYQNFPELLIYCKHGIPNWMLRLIIKYPGATAIKRTYTKSVDGIKGISRTKAEKIKLLASTSIAKSSHPVDEIMIKTLAEDVQHHQQRIEDLKDYLGGLYKNQNVCLLMSIRGIADWTATALVMLLGEIDRFNDTDQIAAFYGVHPRFKQSGDGKWGVRMSKQGNSAMRYMLYIAANNVVLHEPYFKKLYHHYISKGKKPKAVRGIIMHKLLRVIYGMLKNQQPFDSSVDENNQMKTPVYPEQLVTDKSRRYQELNTNAPISRSNYRKRRAVLECQISETDICTASSSTTLLQI